MTSRENALAATRLTLLAEIDRRGLAMKLGHSSVTRWYARAVRITDGSAARQNALGYWLFDHPSVLDALAGGEINAAHAAAIAEGYDVVLLADSTLGQDRRDAIVVELLDTALRSTAGQVSSRAQALAHAAADDARARHEEAEKQRREEQRQQERERHDQEQRGDDAATSTGRPPDPEPPAPEPVPPPAPRPVAENPALNRFDLHALANGRFQFGGDIDRLLGEKLLTALSELTAPRPGPGGERDPRSPSKRRADALDQILDRHLRGGNRGSAGGSRASVHLIVPLRDLLADDKRRPATAAGASTEETGLVGTSADGAGAGAGSEVVGKKSASEPANRDAHGGAGDGGGGGGGGGGDAGTGQKSVPGPGHAEWPFHFDWTGPISRSLAELVTCDADLTPVIVDGNGVPLALGRTTRLASDDQRIALTIRDRCCVMCGRPAQWCQAHHMKFWEHGGRTDLNNLALVCGECHRLVHHGDWHLFMGDDGHPYAVPPESVDPRRQPIPSYHRRKRRAA
ncbi:HNH endonuclease signature motif containing protein [Rhodococcus sp. NKCM2511]|uniref:HNH endonuclease signature motif containing protein n=1 Tax=Rhodococcus sp. NKCM2511 TaxID=2766011 RepID=UPI001F356DB9|nr:HNH endonuclease signature motif containing protein [Rhodococcus sp. NKCM2511]